MTAKPAAHPSDGERYDGRYMTVRFELVLDEEGSERRIDCAVSRAALNDLAGASTGEAHELLATFRAHRPKIEQVAIQRAALGDYAPSVPLLINTFDLNG